MFAQKTRFTKMDAFKLLGIALVFQIVQDLSFWHFYRIKPTGFLSIGLLPAMMGIFILLICYPNFGKNTIFHKAGTMTLGIYVMHPLFLDLFDLLHYKTGILSEAARDLIFPFAIVAGCLLLTSVLSRVKYFKKFVC